MSANASVVTESLENQLTTLATDRLEFGADPQDVIRQLVEMGMNQVQAQSLVSKISGQAPVDKVATRGTGAPDRASGRAMSHATISPGRGLVAAFAAALIGGWVWGMVTRTTGIEFGIVAWGVGLLAGHGVRLFAGGAADASLQFAAVLAAVSGIVFGKYLAFLGFYNEFVTQSSPELLETMAEFPGTDLTELTFFGGIPIFLLSLGEMFDLFDIVFIGLAVHAAWTVAGRFGNQQRPII